jgi:hypothetical protein
MQRQSLIALLCYERQGQKAYQKQQANAVKKEAFYFPAAILYALFLQTTKQLIR